MQAGIPTEQRLHHQAAAAVSGIIIHNGNRNALYKGLFLSSDPRVAYILFVLPFGTHWQVAELQAMWASRVLAGKLGLPPLDAMAESADHLSTTASHEKLGEHYRMMYLTALWRVLFPPSMLWSKPLSAWRTAWAQSIAPITDWIALAPQSSTPTSGDADLNAAAAPFCKAWGGVSRRGTDEDDNLMSSSVGDDDVDGSSHAGECTRRRNALGLRWSGFRIA